VRELVVACAQHGRCRPLVRCLPFEQALLVQEQVLDFVRARVGYVNVEVALDGLLERDVYRVLKMLFMKLLF
jgi:hypothetical protein